MSGRGDLRFSPVSQPCDPRLGLKLVAFPRTGVPPELASDRSRHGFRARPPSRLGGGGVGQRMKQSGAHVVQRGIAAAGTVVVAAAVNVTTGMLTQHWAAAWWAATAVLLVVGSGLQWWLTIVEKPARPS